VGAELHLRKSWGQKVRALRKALKNQRDDLLGFAQVLDEKLDGTQRLKIPCI